MDILAIIEDRNKQLKAYLPAFVTPYMAESMPGTFYILVRTSLKVDRTEDVEIICNTCGSVLGMTNPGSLAGVNIATDEEDNLIVAVNYKQLFDLYSGMVITKDLTWEDILGCFTQEQALHAISMFPIPAMSCNIDGSSTAGKARFVQATGEGDWVRPTGEAYLDFGVIFKRPWVYTLDDIPGLTVHVGSDTLPGIRDELAFANHLNSIFVEKDASTPVVFTKSIPVVNGLMYYPSVNGNELVIKSAMELFFKQTYQYSSVMLIDFREFRSAGESVDDPEPLEKFKLSDCTLRSVRDIGEAWEIIFSMPDSYSVQSKTAFISFDGRLIERPKYRFLNENTILLTLTKLEIQYMRERDVQLTESIAFNTNVIKLTNNVEEWIYYQFNQPAASLLVEARREVSTRPNWINFVSRTNSDDLPICPYCGQVIENAEDIAYPLPDTKIAVHVDCSREALETYTAQEDAVIQYAMECLDSPGLFNGANSNRSFMFLVPGDNIYVHNFRISKRLDYNSLVFNGNIGGLLQSTKGKEIFEYVLSDYMDYHILKNVNPEKPDLVFGSDAHLIGYAPYEFLTTLERSDDTRPDHDTAFVSTPYIDNYAPDVVGNNTNNFNLLDILAIK